jgi:SNF family Na+-dependent transporter
MKANGTDGDGVITLVVAVIGAAVSLGVMSAETRKTAVTGGIATLVCGVIIAAIAGYDMHNLNNVIGQAETGSSLDPGLSIGSGLYLTLVAGIAMALISMTVVFSTPDQPPSI